jgi:dTDP-4-dehydrorhamnose reductase
MKLLVLGHKGMLGRTVAQYFKIQGYDVVTLPIRFGEPGFSEAILDLAPDYIVNGIGKIPQKKPTADVEYTSLNTDLPLLLDTLGPRVIHPTTDCEFKGDIPPGEAYTRTAVRDADDVYGMSKAKASEILETSGVNTKIIRTSIIGHEETTSLSLLDWFLSQEGSVRGYTNHFWNGLTTLQWAKECERIINSWDDLPTLNQIGTKTHYSKFGIITLAKDVYNKDIEIIPFATDTSANKCLLSDVKVPELREQLIELKAFFGK